MGRFISEMNEFTFFKKAKLKKLFLVTFPARFLCTFVPFVLGFFFLFKLIFVALYSTKDTLWLNLDAMISVEVNMILMFFYLPLLASELPLFWLRDLTVDPVLFFSNQYTKVRKYRAYSPGYVLGTGVASTFIAFAFLHKSTVLQSSEYFVILKSTLFLYPILTLSCLFLFEYYKKYMMPLIEE